MCGFDVTAGSIEGSVELKSVSGDVRFDSVRQGIFAGANVTIPYKERIVPMIDRLSVLRMRIE